MDKSLLIEEGEDRGGVERCGLFVAEVKRLGYIAGPMVAVNLSQYFLQIISIMMVGHLGQLSLSSTAIAISFCAVSGFSLLLLLVVLTIRENRQCRIKRSEPNVVTIEKDKFHHLEFCLQAEKDQIGYQSLRT
ncbi:unnamed protein product [Prunus armeniaca]|uniref:Uncharacterized protein n=1 Tax=Prunus armeniaca TaxID=36596 RepID=A0A6J5TMX4_PRUAR|nr:unnamed protein product [Prunus armeniaca]